MTMTNYAPPEKRNMEMIDPPHDCETDGHELRRLGEASDGTTFYRCRQCGKEVEL